MKKDGNPIPELPDYHTSEGMVACMEILKISPPKADGFQLPTADNLIFGALEETTKKELIIAPCKECGQLFVKDSKGQYCSRRCSDLGKVDCERFCGDKEIKPPTLTIAETTEGYRRVVLQFQTIILYLPRCERLDIHIPIHPIRP